MTVIAVRAAVGVVTGVALLFALLPASAHARPAAARAAGAEPADVVLTTATCPICSSGEQERFDRIRADQLGVDALDPTTGRFVGDWPAERNKAAFSDPRGTDNIWFPQGMKKETLCGVLDHFNFFDGSGDEADWNNFMRPDPPYRRLIADAAARYGTTGEWHRDAQGRAIMEAEVTPDEHFYENRWFPKSWGSSALEGDRLCTYGPWVVDKEHDYRPEIHPSELYWWRSFDHAYLLLLQDDSNRFDRREDFDFDGDQRPSWWRAWSDSPRTATFKVAFSVPRFRHEEISVNTDDPVDDVRNNVLYDATDIDDGRRHVLRYNARSVVSVEEEDVPDSFVKVGLGGVCRNAADTLISGYVTLTTKVGKDDRGGEGYHLMRVKQTEAPLFPIVRPLAPAHEVVRSRVDEHSVRTVTVDGRPELVADARAEVRPAGGRRRTNPAVERLRLLDVARFPRLRTAEGTSSAERLVFPVMRRARLGVRLRSGSSATLTLPRVAPAPTLGQRIVASQAAPAQWGSLAAAAGGIAGGSAPPVEVRRVTQLRLDAAAAYAPVRDGKVAREEDSPVAEMLEEALASRRKTRRVFGRAVPATLSWSFTATRALSGRAVAVRVNDPPGPGEIGVRTTGQGIAANATVAFPDDDVYELVARVGMRDRYRQRGRASLRASSLALVGTAKAPFVTGLIRAAAILTGGSPDELVSQAQADPVLNEQLADDRRAGRARALPPLVNDLARDRLVSLEEFRALVRAGRVWAGP